MKVPLSWLKSFVDVKLSAQEIADLLTSGGLEVENIEEVSGDQVLEISLTPNLGHCMSILGIARELAALKKLPVKMKEISVKESGEKITDKISVEIADKEQCHRYACRMISNVKVGNSPDWLKNRLEMCGIRSINNIVDVTNYVMLELGQPLHAFDYEKIAGKKIRVSSKTPYTQLTALDEKNYTFSPGILLITDEKKPLAFAGVMGGMDSGVTDSTREILLESAFFTPQTVRKTSKLLHLRSDSSQRFEKEVDFEGVVRALDLAATLIQEIAHGQVAKGMIDEKVAAPKPHSILCRIQRVNQLLGTSLSIREVATIFERLQMTIAREEEGKLHVLAPSFRNDIKTEIDLIEEVARIYGYDNISLKKPKHISSTIDHSPLFVFEREVRAHLIGSGLQECINCDLISPTLAELTSEAKDSTSWISVIQPASVDQSILRTSLLPGLLQTVKTNFAHQTREIAAFEIGRIHFKEGAHYREQTMAALICTGLSSPGYFDPKTQEVDFYDIKGRVENLLLTFGVSTPSFEVSHLHNFHPGRQARIKVGDLVIGALGEIHPGRLHTFDLDARVFYAEINVHELFQLRKKNIQVKDLPQFPGSQRDWTLTVKEEIPMGHLFQFFQEVRSPLLEKFELVSIYRGSQVGKDRKNVTYRFFYRDPAKTVSLETVEREHTKITQEVAKKVEHLLH